MLTRRSARAEAPNLTDRALHLQHTTAFAGEEFSVGDVAVGSYLLYLPLFFPDTVPLKQAHVWEYMQRLAARGACPPSYKEGMAAALQRGGGKR